MFFGYETKDYILPKEELKTDFSIAAEPEVLYLGEIGAYFEKRKPIILSNGIEIKYREFVKAQVGKKSSCSLENKDYLYFDQSLQLLSMEKRQKMVFIY